MTFLKRRGFRLAMAVALVSLSTSVLPAARVSAAPGDPTVAEMAKRVDAHYNRLHSLRVQFTESYRGMGMERSENGTLLIEKPNRMKWSYAQPAGKVFVVDGKYGYSYTPGDAQAERYPAKQLEDFRSPLRFLLGHTRIEKELTDLTMTATNSGYRLRGVPQGMQKRVLDVQLNVTRDGAIDGIRWQEVDGAITEFHLSDERPNPTLPSGTFSFQPPAGVVVVHGLAPI